MWNLIVKVTSTSSCAGKKKYIDYLINEFVLYLKRVFLFIDFKAETTSSPVRWY